MKKCLLLMLCAISAQPYAYYDVYVMNDTVKPVKVQFERTASCFARPHPGGELPAKTQDHWPMHSNCNADVTFTYPDGTQGKVTAKLGSHHFVITSRVVKDSQGNPIKDNNGNELIKYNWEDQ